MPCAGLGQIILKCSQLLNTNYTAIFVITVVKRKVISSRPNTYNTFYCPILVIICLSMFVHLNIVELHFRRTVSSLMFVFINCLQTCSMTRRISLKSKSFRFD